MKVVDYADGDGNEPPDFAAARTAGVGVAIIRRSVTYWDRSAQAYRLRADRAYARDAQAARDAGLVVGSYLFPAFGLHAPSPAEQVANFVAAEGDVRIGTDLPPALDVEFPGNGVADTGQSQRAVLGLVQLFVQELQHHYGCLPMIYTSHVEWCDSNGLGGPPAPWIKDCPLWVKVPYRLVARRPPDEEPAAAPQLPPPWLDRGWWLRQSQGDALGFHGFSSTVDLGDFQLLDATTGLTDPRWAWVCLQLRCAQEDVGRALEAFQTSRGLQPDRIVGPRTLAALAAVA